MTVQEIVSDIELDEAWGNANFGSPDKRDVIKYSLLKYACGFFTGKTADSILRELGLLTNTTKLTKKGKEYLWAAFNEKTKNF